MAYFADAIVEEKRQLRDAIQRGYHPIEIARIKKRILELQNKQDEGLKK